MRRTSLCLIVLTLLAACTKKEEPTPETPINPDLVIAENEYYPSAIGNYWVYEHYIVYDDGTYVKENIKDSVRITRDTLINGKNYAVLEGSNRPYTGSFAVVDYLRDSVGIVGRNHSRLVNRDTILLVRPPDGFDNGYTRKWWREPVETTVTVPAGTFVGVNSKCRLRVALLNTPAKEEDYDNYFVKGVGPVTMQYNYQFSMETDRRHEKRLVRYHAAYRHAH